MMSLVMASNCHFMQNNRVQVESLFLNHMTTDQYLCSHRDTNYGELITTN